ncbi:peptidase [Sphingobacteriales bacterium UPWRP_1]|nr:peptidase [Sphingobacteriales bacterium TSM_CSM]PSJ78482.1 peptidase [Sphingobacteriales bacterium UPWRP_1]
METKLLPLFPLNLVVYPGEKLNLHIFEPRYRQLISEAVARETTFGIPAFINNEVGSFGTEMRVVSVERYYPEGEMDITALGLQVFEVKQFYNAIPNRLYAGGEVLFREDNSQPDVVAELDVKQLVEQLYETLRIQKTFPDYHSFTIAHHIGLDLEQEYALLQLPAEYERQQFILEHLQQIVPKVIEIERLKLKVQMNGYFKNFKPLDF